MSKIKEIKDKANLGDLIRIECDQKQLPEHFNSGYGEYTCSGHIIEFTEQRIHLSSFKNGKREQTSAIVYNQEIVDYRIYN